MSTHRHTRPLRLLVLGAIGAVLVVTLQSFLKRWQGQLPGQDDVTAAPVEPLAGEVDQQTRAFSLSKTEGDATLYTIQAEQVTTLKETQRNLLHGVVVDIFGRQGRRVDEPAGPRHDRITTPEAEYDPALQTLWLPGQVEMHFGLPGQAGRAGEPAGGQRVIIRTSQLHFDQSSGVANTDAPVRFTFAQGEGSSRGARYDPRQESLHLPADVEFRLTDPEDSRAAPTLIRAGGLRYLRDEPRVMLDGGVEVVKSARRLRARSGVVWLDANHQAQRAELQGDVRAEERAGGAASDTAANVRAERALLEFGAGGVIRTVELLEAVRWEAFSGARSGEAGAQPDREGSSRRMLLAFTQAPGRGSVLDRATAWENVRITLRGGRSAADGAASAAGSRHVLAGEQAELLFAPDGRLPRDARLRGTAGQEPSIELPGETGAPPRIVTARSFDFDFNQAGELTQLAANENVRVVSPAPATPAARADTRITTSQDLLASFSPAGKLSALRQSGNFTYQDAARRAQAASALYEAGGELLTLERGPARSTGARPPQPSITQSEGRIAADAIRLHMGSGDLEASGSVATTSKPPAPSAGRAAGSSSSEPIHAVADQLRYDGGTQAAHYSGRARIWQGTGFLLEAESAVLDRRKSELTAVGKVLTIFRPTGGASAATAGSRARPPVRQAGAYTVRADKVHYAQRSARIVYEGNVRATQDGGTLLARTLEILLQRQAGGGALEATATWDGTASRIEKLIGRGGVQLSETGRTGSGDTIEYFADSRRVNLYGKPAFLSDPAHGSTKGVQLSYQIGDNSASVVGDGGEQTETRWIPAN